MIYSSLKKLAPYLYEITFDALPSQGSASPVIGGCSSYVTNGKLFRNFDWNYNEQASFHVICKGFEGMGAIEGLTDSELDEELLGRLPYNLSDGKNKYGIMVTEHVLYNDWQWAGSGSRNMAEIPYLILSGIKSVNELPQKLGGILSDLYIPAALADSEYLLQFMVTDGEKTYAIMPPENSSGAYEIVDISANPKMANFRWVNKPQVHRAELQTRPNGVERWNAMPTKLENLRFTRAYEAPVWLSEFIGINGTTKDTTDAELLTIYEQAHELYRHRTRNGETWQTVHSVVYSANGMEELFIQEDWKHNHAAPKPKPEPDITRMLLPDIKRDLEITWNDFGTDRKIENYIRDGMMYLNEKYGERADYLSPGIPRTLLFEYVRYRRDNALDVFENNYTSMILAMQNKRAVSKFEAVEIT